MVHRVKINDLKQNLSIENGQLVYTEIPLAFLLMQS